MSLVESLDEALKTLGHEQIMSKILGGSYSDQKICKGCPHRYSKEEPFSVISVDIRNHSSLQDSMEQYVKGSYATCDESILRYMIFFTLQENYWKARMLTTARSAKRKW